MAYLAALLRPRRPGWPTLLVVAGTVLVCLSLALAVIPGVPLAVTTVGALLGGTAFVLGVSATTAAFFERDTYADSDFYR
jgi:hypothetical protein